MDKIRTAIYPRVSKEDQQREGTSFEAQIHKFETICTDTGRELVKVYKGDGDIKDDRSASIKDDSIKIRINDNEFIVSFDLRKRPNFRQMLLDAPNKLFDEIMFFKWDRFSRNIAFQKLAIIYFTRYGIKMYPTDDTLDPFAREIMSVVNEREPKKTGERVKLTLGEKFEKGIMVSSKMPLGYKWNKDTKRVEVDSEKSKLVKDIFEEIVKGVHYKEVCSKFDISPSSLYSLIRNKVYIGVISYEGKEKKGIHKPIINLELFEKANKKS